MKTSKLLFFFVAFVVMTLASLQVNAKTSVLEQIQNSNLSAVDGQHIYSFGTSMSNEERFDLDFGLEICKARKGPDINVYVVSRGDTRDTKIIEQMNFWVFKHLKIFAGTNRVLVFVYFGPGLGYVQINYWDSNVVVASKTITKEIYDRWLDDPDKPHSELVTEAINIVRDKMSPQQKRKDIASN